MAAYDEAKDPPMRKLFHGDHSDTDGTMAFIYFLAQVAGHANRMAYVQKGRNHETRWWVGANGRLLAFVIFQVSAGAVGRFRVRG